MSYDSVTFEELMKKIAKLEAKFPLNDKRKQDVTDVKTLEKACTKVSHRNFEKLADVMHETARLKKRYTLNLSLAKNAVHKYNFTASSSDAWEAYWERYRVDLARKSDKPDEEKAKEIAHHLKKQLAASAKAAAHWGRLAKGFEAQYSALISLSVTVEKARKSLSATLGKASRDATHRRMGEIILDHLKTIEKLLSDTIDQYGDLRLTTDMKHRGNLKWVVDGTAQLAKLKAKDAVAFLQKLAA